MKHPSTNIQAPENNQIPLNTLADKCEARAKEMEESHPPLSALATLATVVTLLKNLAEDIRSSAKT